MLLFVIAGAVLLMCLLFLIRSRMQRLAFRWRAEQAVPEEKRGSTP